jgi:hypothetical protein
MDPCGPVTKDVSGRSQASQTRFSSDEIAAVPRVALYRAAGTGQAIDAAITTEAMS